ncbi:MAG: LON peptidase substrate-binding domain-containing protein [Planctomycetota bacterium]
MEDVSSVTVNFGRPVPLFPLDKVVMMPMQVAPLHLFEPRYRQMTDHALDGPGLIATAMFGAPAGGATWEQEYHGNPPIRPAVCVGRIAEHEKLPDGRYNILLQGLCRARILREEMPDEERMYRRAYVQPIGPLPGKPMDPTTDQPVPPDLSHFRGTLLERLEGGQLSRLTIAEALVGYARDTDIPPEVLIDVAAFALVDDNDMRYRLLAEADPGVRATIVNQQAAGIERMLKLADKQRPEEWPKGVSFN